MREEGGHRPQFNHWVVSFPPLCAVVCVRVCVSLWVVSFPLLCASCVCVC